MANGPNTRRRARDRTLAGTLDAYRRAGSTVDDLLKQVEGARLEIELQSLDPWSVPLARQAELLSAWNVFALQTLGDKILKAYGRASAQRQGALPDAVAEQALAYYDEVEDWVSRARQAEQSLAYRPDVSLPAELPYLGGTGQRPGWYADGLHEGMRSLRADVRASLVDFERSAPEGRRDELSRLRQLLAEADSASEYVEQLWSRDMPSVMRSQFEARVIEAAQMYYRLGQLLAMPRLLDSPHRPPGAVSRSPVRRRSYLPRRRGLIPLRHKSGGCVALLVLLALVALYVQLGRNIQIVPGGGYGEGLRPGAVRVAADSRRWLRSLPYADVRITAQDGQPQRATGRRRPAVAL